MDRARASKDDVVYIMDKRTARKEYAAIFSSSIEDIRSSLLSEKNQGEEIPLLDVSDGHHLQVVIRKRPMIPREVARKAYDALTVVDHHTIVAHDCRLHPNQKNKYVDNYRLNFDAVFDSDESTETVYLSTVLPLVQEVCRGGHATCLMYGQTGTGKTHTMNGIEELAAVDFFKILSGHSDVSISLSFVEVSGQKVNDLLNGSKEVKLCQNSQGLTEVLGAVELTASCPEELEHAISVGKSQRRTEATEVNETSSRSHAIARIVVREGGELVGQLTLVDLAGSEWNADSLNHDLERRKEGAMINASLMALKECLRSRAATEANAFIPYRNSKLTMLLKDSFAGDKTFVTVIATVTPIASDIDHSLSTLKFAKEITEDNSAVRPEPYEIAEHINKAEPLQKWSHETLKAWLGKIHKGMYGRYAANLPQAIDGKAMSRFSQQRIAQLCGGNQSAALEIFQTIRKEIDTLNKKTALEREKYRAGQKAR